MYVALPSIVPLTSTTTTREFINHVLFKSQISPIQEEAHPLVYPPGGHTAQSSMLITGSYLVMQNGTQHRMPKHVGSANHLRQYAAVLTPNQRSPHPPRSLQECFPAISWFPRICQYLDPVIQVTEARLVNTLTSTSLTSRSMVISVLGRYNQKCGVVENEYV
jgi:hypothetical protein